MSLNGEPQSRRAVAVGVVLFVVFALYYLFAARYLPAGAGPDEAIHFNVTHFIAKHHRLPVLPQDQEQLRFTAYGTTRALRPPLSYIVSAIAAKASAVTGASLELSLRLGSVLLCSAAILVAFIALTLYFNSLWMGVVGAALMGLMPQYAFLASYNNDDSAAIFSVSLAVLSMVLILHKGLGLRTAALMGLSIGLIIVSKFTAWLSLPFLAIFLVTQLIHKQRDLPGLLFALFVTSVIGGGWWILFNMYHYGINDPLQFHITRQMIDQYAQLPDVLNKGFAARGFGLKDLLLRNQGGFITESFKAVVGNLDWVRLPVGKLQYGLYLIVFGIGLTGFAIRLVLASVVSSINFKPQTQDNHFSFETLLFVLICFQVFMFTWTNVYNDVQIQGRYLIPVLLPMLILFCASLMALGKTSVMALENWFWPGVTRIQLNLLHVLGVIALTLIVGVHINALVSYVLPFYYPQPRNFDVQKFREWDVTESIAVTRAKDLNMRVTDEGLELDIQGPNAWIIMPHGFCGLFGKRNSIVRVRMWADRAGTAQLYINDGNGYREQLSFRAKFEKGENALVFAVGTEACRTVRFDPMNGSGRAVIREMAAAPLLVQSPQ